MKRSYRDRSLAREVEQQTPEPSWQPPLYRLKVGVSPQYPAGYIVPSHNVLLPRWKRMGLVERVEPDKSRPRRAGARGN